MRTLHRVDIADPHLYDLVLDTHSLGLSMASELIVRAVEMGRPAPRASQEGPSQAATSSGETATIASP